MHYLKDYTRPDFLIPDIELTFELDAQLTRVRAKLTLAPNPAVSSSHPNCLRLHGEDLLIESLALDGQTLSPERYDHQAGILTIQDFPSTGGQLECVHTLSPVANKALSGLFVSDGILCTQCEPEGFRRICFSSDRPDVLSIYTVTLIADAARYPVLLSNGNLIFEGETDAKLKRVRWHDPHPKPSYLFALVAGDLAARSLVYQSQNSPSGYPAEVKLSVYANPAHIDRLEHALTSLARAIAWDEETFDRYCDLEQYILVAVDDFNSGAMENKGLNIFNSSYLLADHTMATDQDFMTIDAVIAHEYFHNWTGNRVTCRDWFQLSLKEGLTVFRENEYMYQMYSQQTRIWTIRYLQTSQFAEDASPTAHPVQPDHYQQINNFYTGTIYEKGAEIIAMLYRLIGREDFRRGLNAYFARFDGQAVTIQNLIAVLLEHSQFKSHPQINLSSFDKWYKQKGTPHLDIVYEYCEDTRCLTLHVKQQTPRVYQNSPAENYACVPLAIAVGLLDEQNQRQTPQVQAENYNPKTQTYILAESEGQLVLEDVAPGSLPIVLEDFSAPVSANISYTLADLERLALHGQDAYVRWQAIQNMALLALAPEDAPLSLTHSPIAYLGQVASPQEALPHLLNVFAGILRHSQDYFDQDCCPDKFDICLWVELLSLPSESFVQTQFVASDPLANHQRRTAVLRQVAKAHRLLWAEYYDRCWSLLDRQEAIFTEQTRQWRDLANLCLFYLAQVEESPDLPEQKLKQQFQSRNLTLRLGVLHAINPQSCDLRDELLRDFHQSIAGNLQLHEKYLSLVASGGLAATSIVRSLVEGPVSAEFDMYNPNQVYALLMGFCRLNPVAFHCADGSGYDLMAQCILTIDDFNPQIAARLAKVFNSACFVTPVLAQKMSAAVEHIAKHKMSESLGEIIQTYT